jgi:hypothetical protein
MSTKFKCCPDFCDSCREHHEGTCPPHEVRTTGIEWYRARIRHLEELLLDARTTSRTAELASWDITTIEKIDGLLKEISKEQEIKFSQSELLAIKNMIESNDAT